MVNQRTFSVIRRLRARQWRSQPPVYPGPPSDVRTSLPAAMCTPYGKKHCAQLQASERHRQAEAWWLCPPNLSSAHPELQASRVCHVPLISPVRTPRKRDGYACCGTSTCASLSSTFVARSLISGFRCAFIKLLPQLSEAPCPTHKGIAHQNVPTHRSGSHSAGCKPHPPLALFLLSALVPGVAWLCTAGR